MLRKCEEAVHFLMLFLLCGAFIPLWREMSGVNTNLAEGDQFHRTILLIGYMISLPFLLIAPRRTSRLILSSPFLWALIGLAFFSSFWSVSPGLTLRRSFAMLLTSLYAIDLVVRFSFSRFMKLFGGVLWSAIFISILFSILLQDWGTMLYGNDLAWRGIFIHKNTLGSISALSLLFFGFLAFKSPTRMERYFWLAGIVQACFTLWESKSITGWMLVIGICGGAFILWLIRATRKDRQIALPLFFLGGSGLGLQIYRHFREIILLFGKDLTLTGRVPLWKMVWDLGLEKPWLGYGFGAFWTGWEGPSGVVWNMFHSWRPDHAHNGYLDVFVNLGFVGLILTLGFLGYMAIIELMQTVYGRESPVFGVLFIGFLMILNLSESVLLRQNSVWWVLLLVYYLYPKLNTIPKDN